MFQHFKHDVTKIIRKQYSKHGMREILETRTSKTKVEKCRKKYLCLEPFNQMLGIVVRGTTFSHTIECHFLEIQSPFP